MKFKAFIFDMDGTLLDTLADLVTVTNMALESVGYPPRTEQEILGFVGSGGMHLTQQAVPAGAPAGIVDHVYETWKMLYAAYGDNQTKPYPGMVDALQELKARGIKLGVFSNKFDAAVQTLADKHFPGIFDVVRGERKGVPRKPDPAGIFASIQDLGLQPDEVAYVGDLWPDAEAASAAGVFLVGVSWGFGGQPFIEDERVNRAITHPSQLLELI